MQRRARDKVPESGGRALDLVKLANYDLKCPAQKDQRALHEGVLENKVPTDGQNARE